MEDNFNGTGDYRFMILENKAAQIRKLLLGSLILAKDTWKEELSSSPKGLDIIMAMETIKQEQPLLPKNVFGKSSYRYGG